MESKCLYGFYFLLFVLRDDLSSLSHGLFGVSFSMDQLSLCRDIQPVLLAGSYPYLPWLSALGFAPFPLRQTQLIETTSRALEHLGARKGGAAKPSLHTPSWCLPSLLGFPVAGWLPSLPWWEQLCTPISVALWQCARQGALGALFPWLKLTVLGDSGFSLWAQSLISTFVLGISTA